MRKSRFTETQIIKFLEENEAGKPTKDICREIGVTPQTFYRWKSKYGGMTIAEAKRLKSLEEENRKLKQMVADLSLDKYALEEMLKKKW